MKRRSAQEREDAAAHEQAEARREALLARLRAREAASRPPGAPAPAAEGPEGEAPGAAPGAEAQGAFLDAAPDPVPEVGGASERE